MLFEDAFEKIKTIYPKVLIIQPTKLCNLSCEYCNARTLLNFNTGDTELSFKDFFTFASRLLNIFPFERVHLLGGEPTIVPISFIQNLLSIPNIKLGITTNLINISSELIEEFNKFERITISIDPPGSKRILKTGKDSYYTVLHNIERISYISHIKFRITLVKGVMDYRVLVEDICKIVNKPKISIAMVSDDIGNLNIEDLVPMDNELDYFEKCLHEDIDKGGVVPLFSTIDQLKTFGNDTNLTQFYGCPLSTGNVTINPKGEIFICDEVAVAYDHDSYTKKEFYVGDTGRLNITKYREILKNMGEEFKVHPKCKQCEFFFECNIGCFIQKFRFGMVDGRRCKFRKILFKAGYRLLDAETKNKIQKVKERYVECFKLN